MKRTVTADEIRAFLAAADRQFVEAGFVIHSVRFTRDSHGNATEIHMTYTIDEEKYGKED